ncbi:alpha/beta hydrolase [Alkalicoccus chagannorensis]
MYPDLPRTHKNAYAVYLDYYGIRSDKSDEVKAGWLFEDKVPVFLQSFIIQDAPSILIVHGYLDHSGGLSRTINFLLQEGYSVHAMDLPGHGLSGGTAGQIDAFGSYAAAVRTVRQALPKVDAAVGHSTGAGVLFQAAGTGFADIPALVMGAPLFEPYKWNIVRRAVKCTRTFRESSRRPFKRNTEDKAYNQFVKQDPLQVQHLHAGWMQALEHWQVQMQASGSVELPVLMLQGARDTTVDWKRNAAFFREKCPNMKAVLYHEAGHQLFNERRAVRRLVEKEMADHLHTWLHR